MNTKVQKILSQITSTTMLASCRPDFLTSQVEELVAREQFTDEEIVEAVLVHFSCFFRDPVVFALIGSEVMPDILTHALFTGRGPRLWSAGCAQGEEAYSLAILLHQTLGGRPMPTMPAIFATDVSTHNLELAREGLYPAWKLEHVTLGLLHQYFLPVANRYLVQPFLKEMIHFSRDDLLSMAHFAPADSVFGDFDLILCRNVVIYYTPEAVARLMDNLCTALRPGGWLVLGHAEFLPAGKAATCLTPVHDRYNIFRKTG